MRPFIAVMLLSVLVAAQDSADRKKDTQHRSPAASSDLASQVPAPRAEDVKSRDALLAAIYDVISGPAGDRDWDRFRSLFLAQAVLVALHKKPDGSITVRTLSVDDYIAGAGAYFKKNAFYERPIANRVQSFGNMAEIFSSYESRNAPGERPFERGINSIQMVNDGKRWWAVSIVWDEERPDNPLPAGFTAGSPDRQ